MTSRSRYIEDDFVAFLAYAGPPATEMQARLTQINMAEDFCQSWFAGKSIDGQWAGFYSAYKKWFKVKQWKDKTIRR